VIGGSNWGDEDKAPPARRVRGIVVDDRRSSLTWTNVDFRTACEDALAFLTAHLPMQLWMVAAIDGDDLKVLVAQDRGYGIKQGDVLPWRDTLFAEMVAATTPCAGADVEEVVTYRETALSLPIRVGAYAGIPLVSEGRSLPALVCGLDPSARPEIRGQLPLLELCGRLLSSVFRAGIRAHDEARRAERAEVDAFTDALTGLVNRRAWERMVAAEEARCRRHRHPASVLWLDVDGLKTVNDRDGHVAGDLLLVATARALQQSTREQDVVARVGGDEFAVLCVETGMADMPPIIQRLRRALGARGVSASIGVAGRDPESGLSAACEAADAAMYEQKRARVG
jgi:diguanylate cyclase (GGDEF)-like protein